MDLVVGGYSLCGVVWYRTVRVNVPAIYTVVYQDSKS